MASTYKLSLFIFRRDLRLSDNNALNAALQLSTQVLPCFIFDPRQIQAHPYQSKPGLQFLMQSIEDLQQQFRAIHSELALFDDDPEQVIRQAIETYAIQAVFTNRDYTPFSRRRDDNLARVCQSLGIAFYSINDALLTEPELATKSDHTPYKVFTAFYNHARQYPVATPLALASNQFLAMPPATAISVPEQTAQAIPGGRTAALACLQQLHRYTDYQSQRDFPALAATSQLSAHLKFGTCSVREAFYAITEQLGADHPLLRQLYWRDFFTHVAYHFPQVFGQPFLSQFANLPWDNNIDYFQAWAEGRTGFPLVDAGMRELNATGFMHNRVRMVVASFLTKDLQISWRWGERYFAQHLVDYDPCVNNGNWQWAASTGCDAQPYFRIFNPWRQQQKFDPDCRYIYRWVPELKDLPPKVVHGWDKHQVACAYPAPIVNHALASQLSKARYKAAATAHQGGSATGGSV